MFEKSITDSKRILRVLMESVSFLRGLRRIFISVGVNEFLVFPTGLYERG